ncbi:MAG TPA: ABC transporter ATP-binding protein [Chitinophagaceae bacterium]|nr:ABC transporter ATP-binding protein [Chitinophagaceae bacterium]
MLTNTWTILNSKEKKQFTVIVLLGIIISIADILALVALLWIIQFYIHPVSNTGLSFMPGFLTGNDSILPVTVFFLLFAIKNIAAFLITKAHYSFTGEVAIRISQNNLVNYQHAGFDEFVNNDSSLFIRKIALQPFEFSQHILSGLQQIITQLILILIAIIAIIIFKANLFLLLLVILLPPVIVVFYLIKKRMVITKKHLRNNNEKSYQYLLDALKGYVESNIYQGNDFFLRRFIDQRRQFSKHLFGSLSLQNMPGRIIEIFAVLGLFILVVIDKWYGNGNSDTLITIGAFMAAAYKIIPGIVKVINLTGQIKAYGFSADELLQDRGTEKKDQQISRSVTIQSVEFKNINFQYDGRTVFNNISFKINKGDFLGISGESGKGKTTILNILLGFLKQDSGEILMNEVSVSREELKQYWPSISYVRQQSFFIHDTVLRNITFDEKNVDMEKFAFASNLSGLDKLLQTFPEREQKIITENGKNISGGQQQRIAIARAIYKNADLILLDEPFNELDEDASRIILEQLKEIAASGKLIIMNTHDKKSLSFCNKMISLNEP